MAVPTGTEINAAFEQYCEAIFELAEDDVGVIQARIAERLGVSRPAVSEMMRRLESEALVETGARIALTERGMLLAESVVRRHRLAERMLTDILGLSWSEAHLEASKWERVLSPSVEAAINRILGDPTTCPHGNPIPGSGYSAPETVQLADMLEGRQFLITRIPEELEFTAGLLEFLESASMTPGHRGAITAVSPDGTVTVVVEGKHVGIGPFAARRIQVAQIG